MSDHPNKTNNPGGDNAIAKGCTCAVIDNAHGNGYRGDPERFAITICCPST